MEVCVPVITSACEDVDVSTEIGSITDPDHPINASELSIDDLRTCLTEFLKIDDIDISRQGFNQSPVENDTGNLVSEHQCKESDSSESSDSATGKCLSKCATFPPLCEPKSSVNGFLSGKETQTEDIKAEISEVKGSKSSVNECYARSISLPTPSKLVSAVKGTREKLGGPAKKLSVTWAPDVYDPVPTSASHVPSNKNQRYSKKSGKSKQKRSSKSSRSSKDKDKKQPRKHSSGSYKLKPLRDDSGLFSFAEPQVGNVDFNVGVQMRSVGVVF